MAARYEFQCRECDYIFEVVQSIHDDNPTHCPNCREENLKKLYSVPGVKFIGLGFEANDKKGHFVKEDGTGYNK